MRGFLSNALKTNDYLKFGILTGALRITKESIFTGLNNLDCFDIANPRYADVFGFTQCEVDQLLSDAGLEEKRDALRAWYDGYHFGDRSDIYYHEVSGRCAKCSQGKAQSLLGGDQWQRADQGFSRSCPCVNPGRHGVSGGWKKYRSEHQHSSQLQSGVRQKVKLLEHSLSDRLSDFCG